METFVRLSHCYLGSTSFSFVCFSAAHILLFLDQTGWLVLCRKYPPPRPPLHRLYPILYELCTHCLSGSIFKREHRVGRPSLPFNPF